MTPSWRRVAPMLVSAVMTKLSVVGAGLLLWSACYRDSSPSIANASDPLGQAPVSCGGADDLAHAVLDPSPDGRLRTHTTGVLSGRDRRSWNGIDVPDAIPRELGELELFVLDEADGGHLALYREPYDVGSCQLGGSANCAYEARFYSRAGRLEWSVKLAKALSRRDHLEIQDLRLVNGVLYFNEACQSYSNEAGGTCSSLVAIDPRARRVLWRTAPLISNGRFVVRGCYLIAGYGFTSEPDTLHLIDRATGAVRQTIRLSSAPERYTLSTPDRLDVSLYSGVARRYVLEGVASGNGVIRELDAAEYGGASYGGGSYGGASYGRP
ncbi:MAG: uncharacterized protein JWP01_1270 [Myxococcales bacterium]|nr:uncharacterized protein [Myxococcales bacterium]